MNSSKTVVLISAEVALKSITERELEAVSCRVASFTDLRSSFDYIYNSFPDLLVIAIDPHDAGTICLLNELKGDPLFGRLPVLAVIRDESPMPAWAQLFVDDFVKRSQLRADIGARAELCIARAERVVEINPLTRLPGNITITRQIQHRLNRGDIFGLAYADLDNFKPFNDRYGFSRGDEVLKMVGRLILNVVRTTQASGSFVGHIGGDDFVFISNAETAAGIAQDVADNFDEIIPSFYDGENRSKRCIESIDRDGNHRTFPIITLSIGIATNAFRTYTHYGEMTEVASVMKMRAKESGGSCVMNDRRRA